MTTPGRDPEALLRYDGFIRNLARKLLARDAEAGGEGRSSTSGWLAGILRNQAGKARRTASPASFSS